MRPNLQYDVPSTAETIATFILDIVLFTLLAWYFDHIDNSNRGKTYGYLFFLDSDYWCGVTKKCKVDDKIRNNYIDELSNAINQTDQKLLDKNSNFKSELNCKLYLNIKQVSIQIVRQPK